MYELARDVFARTLEEIRAAGTWKEERVIQSPQGAEIEVGGRRVLNFCANNYLGLSGHPDLLAAARAALDARGYGLSSVRFICGTQDLHRELERRLAAFFGFGDAILFSSCFDANGGVFEALLGEEDAIVSDALNHASIIDGIRLAKARRYRYAHADLADLESRLGEAADARLRMVVTDGVFSMDGDLARLDEICAIAERHRSLVLVDDSHASGFVGRTGRGTPEHFGVQGRVDILTSTLGKALGGAAGGFVAGPREVVDLLRQRARPYLFSNTLAPPIVGASLAALDLLEGSTGLRDRLMENARRFREAHDRRRLPAPARVPSHRPHPARRRPAGGRHGPRPARGGDLRRRLQLPGGAEGRGPHPRPALRGPHPGDGRPGGGGVREGGAPARGRPRVSAASERPGAAPVGPVVLEGRVVRLVPLEASHVGALLDAANASPEETFPFTWVPRDRHGMAAWVEEALGLAAAGQAVPFATVDAASGTVIGSTRFGNVERWSWSDGRERRPEGGADAVEIGWTWLTRAAQRTGANTEAKWLMLRHAFETWKVHRVQLKTDGRNVRSRAAIERIGARFEGVLRSHMPASDGGLRDTAMYSITAGEWPGVRERFRVKLRGP